MKDYTLLDGYKLPAVGFGTAGLRGVQDMRRIEQALSGGYRLIDTAYAYENEGTVGQALRQSSVPRDQISIQSKLPGRHHKYDKALRTIEESIMRLGVDYIDLYLIHWPNPGEDRYVDAWKALITARQTGLVRSIGVCNFLPKHIERLEAETGVLPVVNQIELHPYFQQSQTRDFHQEKQIVTQAWSPLGAGRGVMEDALISELAQKYARSNGQIVLRYLVQLGAVPLPKSRHIGRQQDNLALFDFELSSEEMERLSQLSKEDGRLFDQHPDTFSDL